MNEAKKNKNGYDFPPHEMQINLVQSKSLTYFKKRKNKYPENYLTYDVKVLTALKGIKVQQVSLFCFRSDQERWKELK